MAAGRIVELDPFRVELLRIEPPTEPLKHALVLLVAGRPEHGEEILIAAHPAAVFGRAGTLARKTKRQPNTKSNPLPA